MSATFPTELFDESVIERVFGAATLRKARGYEGAVSELEVTPERIAAKVQGTSPRPYRVVINVDRLAGGGVEFDASCTCPVGYQCKHTVAALLAARTWEARRRAGRVADVNPALLEWIEGLRRLRGQPRRGATRARRVSHQLLYAVASSAEFEEPEFRMWKTRLNKGGEIAAIEGVWESVERALISPPSFVDEVDLAILRKLWPLRERASRWGADIYPIRGPRAADVLRLMLDSGRLYLGDPGRGQRLAAGARRPAKIDWQPLEGEALIRPRLAARPPVSLVLPTEPFWYVDAGTGQAGELDCPHDPALVAALLRIPPVGTADLPLAAAALAELAPELPPPPAHALEAMRVIEAAPRPVLALAAAPLYRALYAGFGTPSMPLFDFGTLTFDYDGVAIPLGDDRTFLRAPDGALVQVKRRAPREAECLAVLAGIGLRELDRRQRSITQHAGLPSHALAPEQQDQWNAIVRDGLPRLREAGWRIEVEPSFQHYFIEPEAWTGELEALGEDGYALELGIVVEGRRLSLAPLLAELLQRDMRWTRGALLDRIPDNEPVVLRTAEGAGLRMRAQRLKPIVRNLIDLFERDPAGTRLRLSRFDTTRLEDLARTGEWRLDGAEGLRGFAQRLREGLKPATPPAGLAATLREYQAIGLAWLQLLRKEDLGGVLADDMGLGKTLQALAHVLAEKQAGRLDRPALVIAPTSLMHNWNEEARRFAPSLSVLTLHGPQRAERFGEIPKHDLVLTTYALVWRDANALAEHAYSLVILDEAQMVKNAATRGASAVRKLEARQRLALTGTPLENHLGELWTLFDFVLPGFLGPRDAFTRRFRTPIEKQGDAARGALLAQRVRPFLLRRRKQEVARELPPKTTTVHEVVLEGGQRDLYETVRAAMQMKVGELLAGKGLKRSHIEILDALLKLRQVCCDPRLLKLPAARRAKESAKLQLLCGMLPELVEEGRRVLVFSAFAEMLALIAQELNTLRLPHVTLTGQTRDRAKVVERFQGGEVPVFLISLKAGGVGLNLTAADTVVHYDPWWNPAAEDQATDRAHRIGQDKPVFVYKLVAAGSIEQRILELQARKAELVRGVLGDAEGRRLEFTEADLRALLAPLPAAR